MADLYGAQSKFPKGINTKISTANITQPPTDAELDSAFGTPAQVGEGFVGIVDDAGAGTYSVLCWTYGASWYYVVGTKAA